MLKTLINYYYYIFFNAYWTNVNWGDKMIARQSAVIYMNLLKMYILGGVFFVLTGCEIIINIKILLPCGFAVILILNHFALSREVFENKFYEFEFLSKTNKKKRVQLFFSILIIGGLANCIGALFFTYS